MICRPRPHKVPKRSKYNRPIARGLPTQIAHNRTRGINTAEWRAYGRQGQRGEGGLNLCTGRTANDTPRWPVSSALGRAARQPCIFRSLRKGGMNLLAWTTRLCMIYPALDRLRFYTARRRGLEYTMGHGENNAARRRWTMWTRGHARKCLRVSTYITHAPFRSAARKREYASPGASEYHEKNANMHAPALGNIRKH